SKDSSILSEIMNQNIDNLKENNIELEELIADAGYSSGESLQYCQDKSIEAWIPILVNTNPIVKALFTTQRKNNMNAFKKAEIKRYFHLKASRQIAKATRKRRSEVARENAKTDH